MSSMRGRGASSFPLVSVLMAVHNCDRYLSLAIESILTQTFTDFEFIIVDDGSTDASWNILTMAAGKDARIRLLRNDSNLGLPRSLNRGMGLAKGTFIARMDADDVAHPERLIRQLELFESRPGLVMAGSAYWVIDGDGQIIRKDSHPTDDTSIRWQMLFQNAFVHSSVMMRSDILSLLVPKYDENCKYGQDYELWSRLINHGPVANSEEPLISYRLHDESCQRKEAYREQQAVATQVAMTNVKRLGVQVSEQEMKRLRDLYLDQTTGSRFTDLHSYTLLLQILSQFAKFKTVNRIDLAFIRIQLLRKVLLLKQSDVTSLEIFFFAWAISAADLPRFIYAICFTAFGRITRTLSMRLRSWNGAFSIP